MNDREEELLELVGELAAKYTGKESTSITYEKANQLMEAVVYCMNEYKFYAADYEGLLSTKESLLTKVIYEHGYKMVLEKVKKTKEIYNDMMLSFKYYKNRCYQDTFIEGIPAFFLYYDPRFNPQNHILTLDYPVLVPLDSLCGADAISEYVRCVRLEQIFLRKLPDTYIFHVLRAYDPDYEELFMNLAGIVLRNLLGCRIAGKVADTRGYTNEELNQLKEYVNRNTRESLEKDLKEMINEMIEYGYDGNKELGEYLEADVHNFSFELKNAVQNQCLEVVFAV